MGRLIDADALFDMIFEIGCHKTKMHPMEVMEIITAQPTAYDVEKVVAKLEKEQARAEEMARNEIHTNGHLLDFEYFNGERSGYMNAITIVRYGGKE